MAEQYLPGTNRIFYKAWNFGEVDVKVVLYDSKLNNHFNTVLTKAEDNDEVLIKGLYYFEYDFCEGVYVAYFYEKVEGKWEERGVQVYNIREDFEGVITRGGDKGPGVINT